MTTRTWAILALSLTGVAHGASPVEEGLRLHLDASDIDGARNGPVGDPAGGDPVERWADASGGGRHLDAGATAPRRAASGIGGRPAVEFRAGDDALERADVLGGLTGNPTLDIFVVVDASGSGAIVGLGTGAAGQTKDFTARSGFEFTNGDRRFENAPLVGVGPAIGNFTVPANSTYGLHRFARDGVAATVTSETRPNGWTLFPDGGASTRVGGGVSETGGDFVGLIGEVLAFDRELSAAERIVVLNHLSSKYAIALGDASLDHYRGDLAENGDFDLGVAGVGRTGNATIDHSRSDGLRIADAGFVALAGDWVFLGHDGTPNEWTTNGVARLGEVGSRLAREWYVDVTNTGAPGRSVRLELDLSLAGVGRPAEGSSWHLVARGGADEEFAVLPFAGVRAGDIVTFDAVDPTALHARRVTVGTSDDAPQGTPLAVIAEIVATNHLGLDDDEGDSRDWIEIHNPGTEPLDLTGWHLTDDIERPQLWAFPEGTVLDPDERLIVFASGKDGGGRTLHANFRLGSRGDYLALTQDGVVVDEIFPGYPRQVPDVAWGIPASGGPRTWLERATPGRENAEAAAIGPYVANVTPSPTMPGPSDDLAIVAELEPLLGPVASAELVWRVGYDAEQRTAMRAAGDGLFAATIPAGAFGAGDLVRWAIVATDIGGRTSREPRFPDARASPEYLGVVIGDPDRDTSLPVFSWFMQPGTESRADSRSGARATVAWRGAVWDNVFVRVRGGSTASLAKKSYKVDFNPGHHFRLLEDAGLVSEINLNTTYTDKTFLRQALAFELYDLAGAPGCEAFNVRVERGGAFYSIATLTEQPDEDLLEREGRSGRGALYKMYNSFQTGGTAEKKTRRWENRADLDSFIRDVSGRSGDALRDYLFDNVDVPAVAAYLAANTLTQNADSMSKNYYLYRDTEGSGEWCFLPWDVDLTFGRHYMTNDNILGDLLWADADWVLGGASRNVPISPSHPFMGTQRTPGNRSWNRFIDKLFSVPEIADIVRRRLRTLVEAYVQPPGTSPEDGWMDARLAELAAELGGDATRDASRWGQYGQRQTLEEAIDRLLEDYIRVRRQHFFITHHEDNEAQYPQPNSFSALLPGAQPERPRVVIEALDFAPLSNDQAEEYVALRNAEAVAIDLSGWRLEEAVEHTFRGGTVLLPGAALFVTPDARAFRARETAPTGGQGLFIQGNYSGHLSSLGETIRLVDASGLEIDAATYEGDPTDAQLWLRITEVHYHPAAPTTAEVQAGFTRSSSFEFLELTNTSGAVTLDLTGVRFTQGVDFDFTTGSIPTLAPGAQIVVVRDRAAFERRYGTGLPVAGSYGPDRLDDGGETLKLEDAVNGTIVEFRYDDDVDAGWPAGADGAGASLEVVDPHGDLDLPETWRASDAVHGSPAGWTQGEGGARFVRGDANGDARVDISDPVAILRYLFQGGALGCLDAADADDSEGLDITDPIRILSFLFQGAAALPAPFPAPGEDPAGEALGCERGE